jgi:hypothetical protein
MNEEPRRTGSPAFAGDDELEWGDARSLLTYAAACSRGW